MHPMKCPLSLFRNLMKSPTPTSENPKVPIVKNAPKTSAKIVKGENHENLTLHDWMMVFTFIDQHPDMTQCNIVKHFPSSLMVHCYSTSAHCPES